MEDEYLVWSNEHRAWWRPGRCGYSVGLMGAGKYSRADALAICRDAIPSAANVGLISEIPVRYADVNEFLTGQFMPSCVMTGEQ